MHFLQREDIDCEKWNRLVDQTPNAQIYNKSFFLDILAENWCIYTDDNYSKGLVIPYSTKLNVKLAYTPNFIRSFDVLGDDSAGLLSDFIQKDVFKFKSGNLIFNVQNNPYLSSNKKYQEILYMDDFEMNTLSKRMLKKFNSFDYVMEESVSLDQILTFLKTELFPRINNLKNKDFNLFSELLKELKKQGVLKTNCVLDKDHELIAVAVFMEYKNKVTYVKGVATNDSMKNGAMYAVLYNQIVKSRELHFDFDFGGSNLDSIAQFYKNLGGKDHYYSSFEWGKLPRYYKFIRGIYHKLSFK
jgi:hypothetical protein